MNMSTRRKIEDLLQNMLQDLKGIITNTVYALDAHLDDMHKESYEEGYEEGKKSANE